MNKLLMALFTIFICFSCSKRYTPVNSPSFGENYSVKSKSKFVNVSGEHERIVIYNATVDLELKK